MDIVRAARDAADSSVRQMLESEALVLAFPLDKAVEYFQSRALSAAERDCPIELVQLLDLFEVTSVSAAVAIKRHGSSGADVSGIRDALVELWTRAEAARSLVFDVLAIWKGRERGIRKEDLVETARLLAPDAIAIAMRLREPVSQYVEFTSKVVHEAGDSQGS